MKRFMIVFILMISSLSIFPQNKGIATGLYLVIPKDSCTGQKNFPRIAYESDTLCIKNVPIISVIDIESCFTDSTLLDGQEAYALNIELKKSAAKLFKTITEENVGKRIAMIIDNNVVMAPVIRDPVTNGRLTISGESGTALKTLGEKLRKEMNGGF